jgi:hypothetical protein
LKEPLVKAGTEELTFYSETGTYNRDDIPCIDFAVPDELRKKCGDLIERIKEMEKELEHIQ